MELREYQKRAVNWLVTHPRAAIFADCGLGKTAITIEALKQINNWPVLIIAPKRVALTVWQSEFEKWLPTVKCSVIMGNPKQRQEALDTPAEIYVTSYDYVTWLQKRNWPVIVCDESTRLRGFKIKQGAIMPRALSTYQSERFIELTGTPAPKNYSDLYGQLYFIDKGKRLGRSLTQFRNNFMYNATLNAPFPTWAMRQGAQEAIDRLISDVCMSIRGADYLDLLPSLIVDVPCALYDREKYRQMARELVVQNPDITAASAAVMTEKLLQISSGFILDDEQKVKTLASDKLEAVQSILDETQENTIICYRHKFIGEFLQRVFQAAFTTPETIKEWNKGNIPILLLNPASAGHGLNLQYGGRQIIWYEGTWNLEHYQQANERIGPARQRQASLNRQSRYYRLIATPIERYLYQVLEGKALNQQNLMEALSCTGN